MLASSATETSATFTRRDAWRLLAASALLIAAMSAILGLDVLPAQPSLELGMPAPVTIQAPRATHYDSQVLTQQAQDAARTLVEPQYTYSAANGAAVAAQQARAFETAVAPVDTAFDPATTDLGRQAILATALGDLLQLLELAFRQRAGVVKQTADKGRFAVVHVSNNDNFQLLGRGSCLSVS